MNRTRSKYQLHAEIMRTGEATAEFDDAKAGHPMERRLNRLERVAAAYHGRIDLRFASGMLITFAEADASVLGACEMQHRCAVLPQVSRQKLALRIGIHQGLIRQRSKDGADNTREVASHLAVLDDGIVVSEVVVAALNPDLRRITSPLETSPIDISTRRVDWRSEIPSAAYSGESFWPTSMGTRPIGPYLLLHQGLKTLELTMDNPVLTIGRDPTCDLTLTDVHVSRHHCRLERQSTRITLTDSSTNGTTILTDEGEEVLVKSDTVPLKGRGLIFFGRPFNGERRGGVRFESR
jgi:hypothetical protein